MRVTVLGSGTLLPDGARGSAAHLVEAGGARVLLDCGAGAVRALAGRGWRALTHVALTHFHVDHVGDVGALCWALAHGRERSERPPLHVVGPVGLVDWWARLTALHGEAMRAPGQPLRLHELEPGDLWTDPDRTWLRFGCADTPHADPSLALRLQTADGDVGYTGDTGYDRSLSAFFAGVRLGISECGTREESPRPGHLTPTEVAELWGPARPALLWLTHLDPTLPPHLALARLRAAGYDAPAACATDGLTWSSDDA